MPLALKNGPLTFLRRAPSAVVGRIEQPDDVPSSDPVRMDARAFGRDANAPFGDFEQVDLDHAAGEEAVAG
jgi:hypothetical protein